MSQTITTQFWMGTIDSEDHFYEFMGEDPEYWSKKNQEREDYPLSQFISTQDETWYDHDFLEAGYNDKEGSILEKFSGYSWSKLWAAQVETKIEEKGLGQINTFVMIVVDEPPDRKQHRQVQSPKSYIGEGIKLTYVGEISFYDK